MLGLRLGLEEIDRQAREVTRGLTLRASSPFWVTPLGESLEVPAEEGVFSQAREVEPGPGGERQRSSRGGLLGALLRPPKGGRARLPEESGEAGRGLRGDSEALLEDEGLAFLPEVWRRFSGSVVWLLGEGPELLTVLEVGRVAQASHLPPEAKVT